MRSTTLTAAVVAHRDVILALCVGAVLVFGTVAMLFLAISATGPAVPPSAPTPVVVVNA